ncbi:MAG: MFS transporter [bacterium]|nr:MFS transporter [bacterium]
MGTFTIVWFGQLVSLVGSGLTSFALGLWVYQRTGSVTQFALIALFTVLPRLALSPLAGVLVDRWDRRWTMIVSDIGAGLSTSVVAALFFTGRLEVWHIYLAAAASSAFGTFQWPAYTASLTLLVPKRHLGRANGMVQFGEAAAEILAPVLAGVLIMTIELWGVILIDFATFFFAVTTLLLVRFPKPKTTMAGKVGKGALFHEATYGWRYITTHSGLLGLLIFFAIANFLQGMLGVLITPLILNFTSADVLGTIVSIAGGGLLTGSLIMSLWGGPERRITGVLNFELLRGLCFLLIGLRPSALLIAFGAFGAHLTIAIISGSNQALWQSKVAPDVQGRVFATQQMIARSASPLAYLLAGPLADKVFEPLLTANGLLAGSIGNIIGVGPGRGIGILFIVMGIMKVMISLGGYLYPPIRLVEDELPDVATDEPVAIIT